MKNYSFAQVKTRTFPTISDVKHPYIFGNIRSVINVSEKEDADIKALYSQLGIAYHFYPTKEECSDMNWDNIKAAAKVDDFGVIITWRSCINGEDFEGRKDSYGINPLTWKIDNTPAVAKDNIKSIFYMPEHKNIFWRNFLKAY